ncbi:hypothetical protein BMS3Abin03_01216 [bacterium BMS3Abin03]|nr:hypothetical protein BMS3Abin03_01216 [bacterium BMS3Abin03]
MINYKMEGIQMVKSLINFNSWRIILILLITFLIAAPAVSVFAQESNNASTNPGHYIDTLDLQIQKLGKLKIKIDKLQLTVNSNKYLVIKKEMESMHAIDQFIALASLTINVTDDVDKILQHLKIIAATDKLIQNNDTRMNLQKLIGNTGIIINGLDRMIINLENSQKILNEHNAK